jgi:hypothetical protein
MTSRRIAALTLPLAGALLFAACGSSKKAETASSTTAAATSSSAAAASTSAAATSSSVAAAASTLKGVCPDTVVVQTDWFPESEHGATYELMGPGSKASKDTGAVVGPLTFKGKDMGVKLEIRAGGPFLGDQTVVSQMYKDKNILLGYVSTDEAIKFNKDTPVVAVVAPQDKSPQIILWDKKSHPNAKTIGDIAKEVDTITVFGGATYVDYLVAAGIVPKAKVDFNYKGDKILAKPGGDKIAHQGFATAEPYQYAHLDTGAIDVGYQLIYDNGYQLYPEALSVRADALKDANTKACLKALVPMVQQAQIDYIKDHAAADKVIIDTNTTYDSFWKYDQGAADYSVKTQVDLKIVGNGTGPAFGGMDEKRVADLIAKDIPVFTGEKVEVNKDLKPADIMTNEFIDTSIKM